MNELEALYELFGLTSNCSDDELRKAYRQLMFQYHPDKNPANHEVATAKTQEILNAYARLKECRKKSKQFKNFTIIFSYRGFNGIDIGDIHHRKRSFYQAWQQFQQNPKDIYLALKLIHHGIEAGQQEAIYDLLRNSLLIDSASLLLLNFDIEDPCNILIKWADILCGRQLAKEGIQILEDAFATGQATEFLIKRLGSMHYYFIRGKYSDNNKKPSPEIRIKHLNRTLELGSDYGAYTYKLLAEAYYELDAHSQARIYLEKALEIIPEPKSLGAIRISRALGFLPKHNTSPKKPNKYKYNRTNDIPTPSDIRIWAENENWDNILKFADIDDYSPRILSKARNTIRQIAYSLSSYNNDRSRQALKKFLYSTYGDIREMSALSLAKIGDQETLHFLQTFNPEFPRGSGEKVRFKRVTSYLKTRLKNHLKKISSIPIQKILRITNVDKCGETRYLLEKFLNSIDENHSLHIQIMIALAKACANMDDIDEAILLVKAILPQVSGQTKNAISEELSKWLWQYILRGYDSEYDEDYLLALNIHLDSILKFHKPDKVLFHLNRLRDWMRWLGDDEIVEWLSSLIRTEVPGTRYAHHQKLFVHQGNISENLRTQLMSVNDRIKSTVPDKLSRLFGDPKKLKRRVQKLRGME